ncbi:Uncharacterized protein {ECO:0000313/EMBL:CCF07511.1} [Pantoea ananatis]|nr:hypothetical protein PANA5342_0118 [Pantoea ananatis LMG 5342]CRH31437.1 Uncharacterized protein {ECO:0000313/EMBL:CCF07511.1} [Pantoea ananatis]CRH36970.1 Uncharacterized protein BN1183_CP_00050 [Pantoea ananatis]
MPLLKHFIAEKSWLTLSQRAYVQCLKAFFIPHSFMLDSHTEFWHK